MDHVHARLTSHSITKTRAVVFACDPRNLNFRLSVPGSTKLRSLYLLGNFVLLI